MLPSPRPLYEAPLQNAKGLLHFAFCLLHFAFPMLNAIWVLTRTRFLITRNTLWRGRRLRQLGLLALVAAIGLGALGLYNFVGFLVRGMRSPEFAEILVEVA